MLIMFCEGGLAITIFNPSQPTFTVCVAVGQPTFDQSPFYQLRFVVPVFVFLLSFFLLSFAQI